MGNGLMHTGYGYGNAAPWAGTAWEPIINRELAGRARMEQGALIHQEGNELSQQALMIMAQQREEQGQADLLTLRADGMNEGADQKEAAALEMEHKAAEFRLSSNHNKEAAARAGQKARELRAKVAEERRLAEQEKSRGDNSLNKGRALQTSGEKKIADGTYTMWFDDETKKAEGRGEKAQGDDKVKSGEQDLASAKAREENAKKLEAEAAKAEEDAVKAQQEAERADLHAGFNERKRGQLDSQARRARSDAARLQAQANEHRGKADELKATGGQMMGRARQLQQEGTSIFMGGREAAHSAGRDAANLYHGTASYYPLNMSRGSTGQSRFSELLYGCQGRPDNRYAESTFSYNAE